MVQQPWQVACADNAGEARLPASLQYDAIMATISGLLRPMLEMSPVDHIPLKSDPKE